MNKFNEFTPFILIARIHVKENYLNEYLQLAEKTDDLVKTTEPGMLHHTFDQDPNDNLSFTWSEVYQNDEAFIKHLNNPIIKEYLDKHNEYGDGFSVEVYGTVGEKCLNIMKGTGLPLKIFNTKYGYSRVNEET